MVSGQHHQRDDRPDAILLLAIRQEVEEALQPCMRKVDAINDRLAAGDTAFALLRQEQQQQQQRCLQHGREPATDRQDRKPKDLHPLLLVAASTVVSSLTSLTLLWWLGGLAAQAAKGSP
jgi:hypothetical protein